MSGEDMLKAFESLEDRYKTLVVTLIEGLAESNEKKNQRWIDTDEAAETLGLTRATIRTYALEGKLEGRRVSPRKILVSKQSVDRLKMAQTRF